MQSTDQDIILVEKIQDLELAIKNKDVEITNLKNTNNKFEWFKESVSNNIGALVPISVISLIILGILWFACGWDTNNFYMDWCMNGDRSKTVCIYQEINWGYDRKITPCEYSGPSTVEKCNEEVLRYEGAFNKFGLNK